MHDENYEKELHCNLHISRTNTVVVFPSLFDVFFFFASLFIYQKQNERKKYFNCKLTR
jgi:hypothetical protein